MTQALVISFLSICFFSCSICYGNGQSSQNIEDLSLVLSRNPNILYRKRTYISEIDQTPTTTSEIVLLRDNKFVRLHDLSAGYTGELDPSAILADVRLNISNYQGNIFAFDFVLPLQKLGGENLAAPVMPDFDQKRKILYVSADGEVELTQGGYWSKEKSSKIMGKWSKAGVNHVEHTMLKGGFIHIGTVNSEIKTYYRKFSGFNVYAIRYNETLVLLSDDFNFHNANSTVKKQARALHLLKKNHLDRILKQAVSNKDDCVATVIAIVNS
ncbi:MAG: hypothetical protein ISR65_13950 [Bacteriovoracaceae bacterium]|nr:hypothetical protein [Bacteriovoracaceae bacterium]